MNKIFYFLMVGLTFAVLNVATVAAQTAMPGAGDAAAVIPDMSGAAITGSDSVVCDGLPTKRQETNCLRDVLDDSPYAVAKKKDSREATMGVATVTGLRTQVA